MDSFPSHGGGGELRGESRVGRPGCGCNYVWAARARRVPFYRLYICALAACGSARARGIIKNENRFAILVHTTARKRHTSNLSIAALTVSVSFYSRAVNTKADLTSSGGRAGRRVLEHREAIARNARRESRATRLASSPHLKSIWAQMLGTQRLGRSQSFYATCIDERMRSGAKNYEELSQARWCAIEMPEKSFSPPPSFLTAQQPMLATTKEMSTKPAPTNPGATSS